MKSLKRFSLPRLGQWICFTCLTWLFLLALPVQAQEGERLFLVLTTNGPLTPAMAEYIHRGIESAEARGAEALILQLNTPGGSIDLMNRIVEDMLASEVPVIVYVAPRGATAGSAGTVITLAGHVAAMAPETVIGAASPVGPEGEDLGETLEAKTKNALKAKVRSLAQRRGSTAVKLAEATIETAEAVTAHEALEAGLIDFIATDLDDLLKKLEGFQVETSRGNMKLHTSPARLETFKPTLIEQVLATLTNPNIVFLLLAIGFQAVLIELSSPGGWLSGFIGVVCLLLATYGLGVLDVNWFGILFLIVAFVLFILDIKAPTHGALTAAAVGSLIVGALVLFNSPGVPSFQRVSIPLIIGTSLIMGAVFFTILMFALRAQATPHWMGQESLIGKIGIARGDFERTGIIQLEGEQWSAELLEGEPPAKSGERLEVVEVQGLKVRVRKAR